MSDPDYEYRGLMAATWDLLRGDTSGWPDRSFYLEQIAQHGQPVLDIGCGTGRLLLEFAGSGIDADGVDNSPEMLELCRRKADGLGLDVNLFQQDMESLDLPRRYQIILVPSSSFQLVLDPRKAARAMQRFFEHLLPGGVLVMPFMLIWEPGDPLERDWELLVEIERPEDGALVRRWGRDWFDPENQLEHTESRYELLKDGKVVQSELHRRSPATRWYTQAQASQLYHQAGFRNLQVFKAFSSEPASESDSIFTISAQKLGG